MTEREAPGTAAREHVPRLEVEELRDALRAADEDARVVPPWIIRRVIKARHGITGFVWTVPHRDALAVPWPDLLQVVGRDELGLAEDDVAAGTALLVAQPGQDELEHTPAPEILRLLWRRLFHARVHAALADADDLKRQSAVRERIDRLGQTAFDEVRAVLEQEHLLLPPRHDHTVYEEFVATYLELLFFEPALLAEFFPSLPDTERVRALLARDVFAVALVEATRPEGAAPARRPEPAPTREPARGPAPPPRPRPRRLAAADRASRRGNAVRAALLRAAAGPLPDDAAAAQNELDALAGRLAEAAGTGGAGAWRAALPPLLPAASGALRTPAARLLYDLQKVCVEHERGLHSVDLGRWLRSFGRRPLRCALPHLGPVLACRHLTRARQRLRRAPLGDDDRSRLDALLSSALEAGARRVRERLGPLIREALQASGLVPGSVVQRVAARKVVEELLDRVVDRGFLDLGDLRDALARNQLKLDDVRGPRDLARGPLLDANRRLLDSAIGIHRGGEVYLRGLQRASALASGTAAGRLLARFVVLPFGGAFVILEGLHHLMAPPLGLIGAKAPHLVSWPSVTLCGAFVLALVHAPAFRRRVASAGRVLLRGLRTVLLTAPLRLARLLGFVDFLQSAFVRRLYRWVLKPAAYALVAWLLLLATGAAAPNAHLAAVVLAVVLALALNSRPGRRTEEAAAAWMRENADRLRRHVVLGLVRLVISFFRRVLDAVERVLYAVDEHLRFRTGASRTTVAAKAVARLLWGVVAWIVRLYVNLFVEPQVNPVKHFPVVTVSHKIILPFSVTLTKAFAAPLLPLVGGVVANAVAGATVFLLPGVFGFLVWELKENWKLFAANRARHLRPVPIGHHGETMVQLLEPGFHSGTLPRLYGKLRRARRREPGAGGARAARRHRDAIHDVEHAVASFVDRELLALLREGGVLGDPRPRVTRVMAGSNVLHVDVARAEDGGDALRLSFEEQSGWLVAGLGSEGWTRTLGADARRAFRDALAGLYALAGVDLVRQQIEAALAEPGVAYDVGPGGLVVWPGDDYEHEVVYDLSAGTDPVPCSAAGRRAIPRARLVLAGRRVPFRAWESAWEERRRSGAQVPAILPEVALLPREVDIG